ncbi:MAG: hypothetical protein QW075_04695 [Thermofilaceae archaeon]
MEESGGMAVRKRGQVRVIEAVLAVFMAVALILMVMGFTRPLRSQYIRETSDLRRLAYNVMSMMSQANTFEATLAERIWAIYDSGGMWQPAVERLRELELILSMSLPPGLLYRLDVYLLSASGGAVELKPLGFSSNYDADRVRLTEAESITYTYTMTGSKSLSYSDGFDYSGLPRFISTITNGHPNTNVFIKTSGTVSKPPSLCTQVDARGDLYGIAAAVYDVASTLDLVPAAGFTVVVTGSYSRDSIDRRNNVAYVSVGVDSDWDGLVDVEYIFYRYDTSGGPGKIISIFASPNAEVCSVGSDGSCNPVDARIKAYNLGSMISGYTYSWNCVIPSTRGRVIGVALVVVDADTSDPSGARGDFWLDWDDLQLNWGYENIRGTVLQIHLTIGYAG